MKYFHRLCDLGIEKCYCIHHWKMSKIQILINILRIPNRWTSYGCLQLFFVIRPVIVAGITSWHMKFRSLTSRIMPARRSQGWASKSGASNAGRSSRRWNLNSRLLWPPSSSPSLQFRFISLIPRWKEFLVSKRRSKYKKKLHRPCFSNTVYFNLYTAIWGWTKFQQIYKNKKMAGRTGTLFNIKRMFTSGHGLFQLQNISLCTHRK